MKLLVHDLDLDLDLDLDVTIVNTTTGEILRQLTIDTSKDYQPTGKTHGHTRKQK